jgi:hypothetical protein
VARQKIVCIVDAFALFVGKCICAYGVEIEFSLAIASHSGLPNVTMAADSKDTKTPPSVPDWEDKKQFAIQLRKNVSEFYGNERIKALHKIETTYGDKLRGLMIEKSKIGAHTLLLNTNWFGSEYGYNSGESDITEGLKDWAKLHGLTLAVKQYNLSETSVLFGWEEKSGTGH